MILACLLLLVTACAQEAAPETVVETVPETVVETVEVKVVETVEVEKEVVKTVEVEKVVEVEVTPMPEENEPVELRMAWWGSQNRHTRTIGVIKLFEQKYPWITIKYEPAGWNDHWTKLTTQAAGGNLPDIIQQDYARLSEWVGNDLLLPLDEYVESGIIDFSNVNDVALDGGRIDGQLYAVNIGINSQAILVDVDAFAEAGVGLPAQDWTWDDFEAICMEYHEKTGEWCIGAEMNNEQMWKSLYLGYDQWAFSTDGTSLGYDDDQPIIDYMNMLLRLQEAGAMPTREEEIAQFQNQGVETRSIVTGDAAMENIWSNQIVAVWTAAGPDRSFVMNHLPRPADGCCSSNYVKPSQFLSVTAHSEHPEEAAMFIDFFTNSIEANEILMAERGVPVSSVVADALKPLISPAQREMFDYMARVQGDSMPVPPPDPSKAAELRDNIYFPEFVDPVLYGLITAEEGAATLREMATDLLAQ